MFVSCVRECSGWKGGLTWSSTVTHEEDKVLLIYIYFCFCQLISKLEHRAENIVELLSVSLWFQSSNSNYKSKVVSEKIFPALGCAIVFVVSCLAFCFTARHSLCNHIAAIEV